MTRYSLTEIIDRQGYVVLDGCHGTGLAEKGFELNTALWTAGALVTAPGTGASGPSGLSEGRGGLRDYRQLPGHRPRIYDSGLRQTGGGGLYRPVGPADEGDGRAVVAGGRKGPGQASSGNCRSGGPLTGLTWRTAPSTPGPMRFRRRS